MKVEIWGNHKYQRCKRYHSHQVIKSIQGIIGIRGIRSYQRTDYVTRAPEVLQASEYQEYHGSNLREASANPGTHQAKRQRTGTEINLQK